ncbi:MAG: hypothetical protein ACLFVR_15665 [Thiohalospira sp.]
MKLSRELKEKIKSKGYDLHDYRFVSWCIINHEFAQNKDMLNYYLSLSPSFEDVKCLIRDCDFARDNLETNFNVKNS